MNPLSEPLSESGKIQKSDAEWRAMLTPEQYAVARKKGTEAAFSGEYYHMDKEGLFTCVCCGAPLFSTENKYDSGSGWPSFWQSVAPENIATESDTAYGMQRTELMCSQCDAHLGHVFEDGPQPTGLRFCINSASLAFKPNQSDADSNT